MGIRALKPSALQDPAPRVLHPQCEATPDDSDRIPEWRRNRYRQLRPDFDPLKCQRASSVEINGRCYCAPHAGKLALRKWLKGELTERPAPEPPGGRVDPY